MLSVVRDGVQNEMDECLVRCVATSSEEETNNGINPSHVSLSVGFSFLVVVLSGLATLECAGLGLMKLVLAYSLDFSHCSIGCAVSVTLTEILGTLLASPSSPVIRRQSFSLLI